MVWLCKKMRVERTQANISSSVLLSRVSFWILPEIQELESSFPQHLWILYSPGVVEARQFILQLRKAECQHRMAGFWSIAENSFYHPKYKSLPPFSHWLSNQEGQFYELSEFYLSLCHVCLSVSQRRLYRGSSPCFTSTLFWSLAGVRPSLIWWSLGKFGISNFLL